MHMFTMGEGMMVKWNVTNLLSYLSLSFVSPRMNMMQRKLHDKTLALWMPLLKEEKLTHKHLTLGT